MLKLVINPVFVLLIFSSLLGAKEPSAFELQSGSTKKEMQTLKGQTESQSDKIFELENKIKHLETSNEGIKSIYESQATSINDLNNKIKNIDLDSIANKTDVDSLKEQISINTANIKTLTESLQSMSDSIMQIKDLLNQIQQSKENTQTSQISNIDSNKTQAINETKDLDISFQKDTTRRNEIFKEARSLTYAKKFDEAKLRYNWFIEIDYKKAESHYMLGNIAYASNQYNDAIYHYKESALLDDKAKYMPRLLLNCANSLRVLNRIEDAKNFYNSLISRFPNSDEAKDAKKQINKIN